MACKRSAVRSRLSPPNSSIPLLLTSQAIFCPRRFLPLAQATPFALSPYLRRYLLPLRAQHVESMRAVVIQLRH